MNKHIAAAIPFRLRWSGRAKYLRIIIKPGCVEVVAPLKTSEKQIYNFVSLQQDWIKAALQRVGEKVKKIPELAPVQYADGVTVPFQGRQIPLQVNQLTGKTIRVQLHVEAGFVVTLPGNALHDQQSELIRHALINWMKKQARQLAVQLIAKHADKMQLFPRSLKIKTLKSRWGSCGPNNDINLNWLLLLAPPLALEYVIVHELCHIKHKNHSREFWSLVATHFPDYQQQRIWLKQHGASLMRGL